MKRRFLVVMGIFCLGIIFNLTLITATFSEVIEDPDGPEEASPFTDQQRDGLQKIFHRNQTIPTGSPGRAGVVVDERGVVYIKGFSWPDIYYAFGHTQALAKAHSLHAAYASYSCQASLWDANGQVYQAPTPSAMLIRQVAWDASTNLLNATRITGTGSQPKVSPEGSSQSPQLTYANNVDVTLHMLGICEQKEKLWNELTPEQQVLLNNFADGWNAHVEENKDFLTDLFPNQGPLYHEFRLTGPDLMIAGNLGFRQSINVRKMDDILTDKNVTNFRRTNVINADITDPGASNSAAIVGDELPEGVLSQLTSDPHGPITQFGLGFILFDLRLIDQIGREIEGKTGYAVSGRPFIVLGATNDYANMITAANGNPNITYKVLLDPLDPQNRYLDVHGSSQPIQRKLVKIQEYDGTSFDITIEETEEWGRLIYKNVLDPDQPYAIGMKILPYENWVKTFLDINFSDGYQIPDLMEDSEGKARLTQFNFMFSRKDENSNAMVLDYFHTTHAPKWGRQGVPKRGHRILDTNLENYYDEIHGLKEGQYAVGMKNTFLANANNLPEDSLSGDKLQYLNNPDINKIDFFGGEGDFEPTNRFLSHQECLRRYLNQGSSSDRTFEAFTDQIATCTYNWNYEKIVNLLYNSIVTHGLMLVDPIDRWTPERIEKIVRILTMIDFLKNYWDYKGTGNSILAGYMLHYRTQLKNMIAELKADGTTASAELADKLRNFMLAGNKGITSLDFDVAKIAVNLIDETLNDYVQTFGGTPRLRRIAKIVVTDSMLQKMDLPIAYGSSDSAFVANFRFQDGRYIMESGSGAATFAAEHYADGTYSFKFNQLFSGWDFFMPYNVNSATNFSSGVWQELYEGRELYDHAMYQRVF